MSELTRDQAAGLRRLVGAVSTRVVAIVGAGRRAGRTATAANFASTLARSGKDLLLLDGSRATGNLAAVLGLVTPAADLDDVLARRLPLRHALVAGSEGIWLLPAARGMERLAVLDGPTRASLFRVIGRFAQPLDMVFVDASHDGPLELLDPLAHDVVVVVRAAASAMTESYALIKHMHSLSGRRDFQVLVNRVGSAAEADGVFDNLARVARRYLAVNLRSVGHVLQDDSVERSSRLRRPVVEAFPTAPAAIGFRHAAAALCNLPGEWGDPDPTAGIPPQRVGGRIPVEDGVPCIQ